MNVLGMHRAGTSLTARVLNLLGVDLGDEAGMIEPRFDNPRGYWEQRAIMELNDEIFAALGGTWWRPPPMPAGWHEGPAVAALRERARELLDEQFDQTGLWGWKDPRTSLTLPFWRELVPDARYVVCLRNPLDVVASLLRREPKTHTWDSAVELWLRYTAGALLHTEGAPRALAYYEDWFDDTDAQVANLASFIGQDPASISPRVRSEIDAFIETDLQHHRSSPPALAETETLAAEARALYLALRAGHLARTGAGEHRTESDATAAAIERFAPSLWAVYAERTEAASASAAAEALRAERDRAVEELRGARVELDGVRAELDGTERERRRARSELDMARDELNGAGAQLEETRMELEATRAERDRARAALDGSRGELERHRAWLVETQSSLSWQLTRPLRTLRRLLRGGR